MQCYLSSTVGLRARVERYNEVALHAGNHSRAKQIKTVAVGAFHSNARRKNACGGCYCVHLPQSRLREFFLPCQRTATETLPILPWLLTLALGLARACFWMCNSQPPKTQRCQVNATVLRKKKLDCHFHEFHEFRSQEDAHCWSEFSLSCCYRGTFFSHVKSCRSRNVVRHTSDHQGRGQDSSAIDVRQQRRHEFGLALCVMDLE